MTASWFEDLFGFREDSYDETRQNLEVAGTTLRSRVNQRSYTIGELTTPTLRELREQARSLAGGVRGPLKVSSMSGDVRTLHSLPTSRHALFQVASQFNLLEMTGPDMTPEHGVTRYVHDRTQGPACALAAAAATVYRNYFAPVAGHLGQRRERQIDCLSDLGEQLGNRRQHLWEMRNGYALCTEPGLAVVTRTLEALEGRAVDELRDLVRIGIHSGVQVTDVQREHLVTQAFCSALPVRYSRIPAPQWQSFARLVLEAAYEATLWAAVVNAATSGSNVSFLTLLGGGAFGNEPAWIRHAMRRALMKVAGLALDVRVVSYGRPDASLLGLVAEFAQ